MKDEKIPDQVRDRLQTQDLRRSIIGGFLFILICVLGSGVGAQEKTKPKTVFYGMDHFLIEGTRVPLDEKESPYDRLPASYKEKVREPVWNLSKNSAGISVRFRTNSTSISVKWSVLNDTRMNHMAETGIKGVDLYVRTSGKWKYVDTGRPADKENEALMVENMSSRFREFRVYLPLYDGTIDLQIGIDSVSQILRPEPNNEKPIVFYGTSITQGGCASRPGMVHTSIVSRELDIEAINFGFSGNGRMEEEIVELISGIDAAIYIIECLPNMNPGMVEERTVPLVEKIRERRPDTPIVLVENFIYDYVHLDIEKDIKIRRINMELKQQYHQLIESGVKELYYLPLVEMSGGTVDGVHFTDYGFMMYGEYLIKKLDVFGLISK